jgi:MFS family permease
VRLTGSLAPLGRLAYRLLWVGQTASEAGNALFMVAFVFAILRVGGTAADVGYILAIQTVAAVTFVLVGGVWADRLRRQAVMLASDLARALVEGALAVLLVAGRATLWELALGAGVLGVAGSFFQPAATGLVAETVPAQELQRANGLLDSAASFVGVGGPAVAGVLVAAFDPGVVLAIDAATFLASAVTLAMLRLPPRVLSERGSFRRDLAVGWHEVATRSWYWISLIAHACWNVGFGAYLVLGPVIARMVLGGAPAWGALSAAWAAGAVAGGIAALRLRPRRPLVVGNLALAAGALPLLALAPPLATWEIGVAAALGGTGMTFLSTVWAATVQSLIPDEARSRADSYDWLVSLAAMPVGLAAAGPIAERIGDTATLIGAALFAGLPCALVVLVPAVRRVRTAGDGSIVAPRPTEPVAPR